MLTLFLCGDVMTGRGIDQVLPHPNPPRLFEPYVTSARQYVELAEQAYGPIAKPVDFAYIWGEALAELDRVRPDLRIVNLETRVGATAASTDMASSRKVRRSWRYVCLLHLGILAVYLGHA